MLGLVGSCLSVCLLIGTVNFWYNILWGLSLCCLLSLVSFYKGSCQYTMIGEYIGSDLMRCALVRLTIYIFILVILASGRVLQHANKVLPFIMTLVSLLLGLVFAFLSVNIFLFYFLFETALLPTLYLIIGWGYQPERLQAGIYLMLYTILASLPLLVGLRYFFLERGSNNFLLSHLKRGGLRNEFIWWAFPLVFYSAFLVKIPTFGVHLWLPKAHVEASVSGSIILAAVLLKLGGYGLLRTLELTNPIGDPLSLSLVVVALWGGVLTCVMALRQVDSKSLIAYSSVGHMRLVTAGVLLDNTWGWMGALTLMVAHGFSSSALFRLANVTAEKVGSRRLMISKGLLVKLPILALCWFSICVVNLAAPPSINLLGEVIIYTRCATHSSLLIVPLGLIRFLTAVYSIFLYVRMCHGQPLVSANAWTGLRPVIILVTFMHWVPVNLLILNASLVWRCA